MRLRNKSHQMDDFTSLTVECLMLELAVESARGLRRISERKCPLWVDRVKEMQHEDLNERRTLTSMAQAVGLYPAYLAGVFKQYLYCSVGEYVRPLPLYFACRGLSKTDSNLVLAPYQQKWLQKLKRRMLETNPLVTT